MPIDYGPFAPNPEDIILAPGAAALRGLPLRPDCDVSGCGARLAEVPHLHVQSVPAAHQASPTPPGEFGDPADRGPMLTKPSFLTRAYAEAQRRGLAKPMPKPSPPGCFVGCEFAGQPHRHVDTRRPSR